MSVRIYSCDLFGTKIMPMTSVQLLELLGSRIDLLEYLGSRFVGIIALEESVISDNQPGRVPAAFPDVRRNQRAQVDKERQRGDIVELRT